MINLLTKLQDEMKVCLKSGQKERLSVVRMLLSEIKNVQVNTPGGREREWSDTEIIGIISGYHKMLVKTCAEFPIDRQEALKKEIVIVEEFLPQQLTLADINLQIQRELENTAERNFGALMKLFQAKFAGKTDGKTISEALKNCLLHNKA